LRFVGRFQRVSIPELAMIRSLRRSLGNPRNRKRMLTVEELAALPQNPNAEGGNAPKVV